MISASYNSTTVVYIKYLINVKSKPLTLKLLKQRQHFGLYLGFAAPLCSFSICCPHLSTYRQH